MCIRDRGKLAGEPDCDAIINAGMDFLWHQHRDGLHGGYLWSVGAEGIADGIKLAYGHVFVLLAAASAKKVGHPDADRMIADISAVLDRHYWDEDHGLLRDEFTRDWQVFSTYRGMNANMHGVEALLAAFEATGEALYLTRAGRILDFFIGRMAPRNGWRLPEHHDDKWLVDAAYQGLSLIHTSMCIRDRPCKNPSPRWRAPRVLAMSRATEGFSATTAMLMQRAILKYE